MSTTPENAVKWEDMQLLASEVDALYDALVVVRTGSSACTSANVETSLELGMPILLKDKTAPFFHKFDTEVELFQRFEFGYVEGLYEQYINPDLNPHRKPVYHSCYLTTTLDAADTSYYTVDMLTEDMRLEPDQSYNLEGLIETPLHLMNKWWPKCSKYSDVDEVAAELYFVPTDEGACPCKAVVRMSFASATIASSSEEAGYLNQNGGILFNRLLPEPLEENYHTFTAPVDITMAHVDLEEFKPERYTSSSMKFYDPPPVHCCNIATYPKLGEEGGGEDQNVYFPQMFNPWFSPGIDEITEEPNTRPFKIIAGPMAPEQYDILKPDIRPHGEANMLDTYDANSHFEQWRVCFTGDSNDNKRKLTVRVTALKFEYVEEVTGDTKIVVAYVPTSVTMPLKGRVTPAIRKRWYDMIYQKLRFIAGAISPDPDANAAQGVTWNVSTFEAMLAGDAPCSALRYERYLPLTSPYSVNITESQFGAKYFEQWLCYLNSSTKGEAITCPSSTTGFSNLNIGGFASDKIVPISSDPECYDNTCEVDLTMPWDGGCYNAQCEEEWYFKTYKYTMDALWLILNEIKTNKVKEPGLRQFVGNTALCQTYYFYDCAAPTTEVLVSPSPKVIAKIYDGCSPTGVSQILEAPVPENCGASKFNYLYELRAIESQNDCNGCSKNCRAEITSDSRTGTGIRTLNVTVTPSVCLRDIVEEVQPMYNVLGAITNNRISIQTPCITADSGTVGGLPNRCASTIEAPIYSFALSQSVLIDNPSTTRANISVKIPNLQKVLLPKNGLRLVTKGSPMPAVGDGSVQHNVTGLECYNMFYDSVADSTCYLWAKRDPNGVDCPQGEDFYKTYKGWSYAWVSPDNVLLNLTADQGKPQACWDEFVDHLQVLGDTGINVSGQVVLTVYYGPGPDGSLIEGSVKVWERADWSVQEMVLDTVTEFSAMGAHQHKADLVVVVDIYCVGTPSMLQGYHPPVGPFSTGSHPYGAAVDAANSNVQQTDGFGSCSHGNFFQLDVFNVEVKMELE